MKPIYKAVWYLKRTRKKCEGTPTENFHAAMADGHKNASISKTVHVLRDSQGTDHPSNAGTFFLHWIIK